MADKEIKIRFTVDDNGVVQKIDGIEDAVKKTGKTAAESASGFTRFEATVVSLSAALDLGQRAFSALQSVVGATFSALDRAAQVENLTRSFENLQDSIGDNATAKLKALQDATRGLVSDQELLQQANQAVLLGVDDGSGKFEELAAAALKLGQAQGITAAQAIESLTVGIGRQSKQVLDNLGVIVEAEKAYAAYSERIGKTTEQLSDQERRLAFNEAAFKSITEKAKQLSGAELTAAQSAQGLNATIQNLTDQFVAAFSSNEDLNASINKFSKAISEINVEDFANDFAILASSIIDVASAASSLINTLSPSGISRNFNNIKIYAEGVAESFIFWNKEQRELTKNLSIGLKILEPTAQNFINLKKIYDELRNSTEDQTVVLGIQTSYLRNLGLELQTFERQIEKTEQGQKELTEVFVKGIPVIEETTEKIEQLGNAQFDFNKYNTELENAVSQIAAKLSAESDQIFESAEQIGADFIRGIIDGASGEELAAGLGGALGFAITGSPVGQVLGEKLGVEIFNIFEKAFGGKTDAAANARENFFQFLRDSIGRNEALVLIEDEFRPIGELFRELNRDIFDPQEGVVPIFENLFALAPEVQSAFFGVGEALTQLFDDVSLDAGQVAALLAENLGGSLNNLQVLIQSLSISVGELEEAMIEAAKNGEISFLEAESALRQIGQLAETGIPGQIGAVSEAFDNLKKAGEQGGLFTIDALRDIGAEAAELGATSLVDLRQALEDAGVSADDLNKFFESLAEVGIGSVQALADITDRQAIQVLADLETIAFGFLETTNQAADDLVSRLENIPDQIESRIVIDVETRARDQGAQQVIDSGALGLTL